MKSNTNNFDKKLAFIHNNPNVPYGLNEAAVYVHDTLDLAWASAKELFGESATPDIALAIFDRISSEQKYIVNKDKELTE